MLIADGVPVIPRSLLGPITPEERQQALSLSPVGPKYDEPLDRDSAYELLQGRATTVAENAAPHSPWGAGPAPRKESGNPWGVTPETAPAARPAAYRPAEPAARRVMREPAPEQGGMLGSLLGDILTGGVGKRQGVAEALTKSMVRSVGSSVGRQVGTTIVRGVLGSILKR